MSIGLQAGDTLQRQEARAAAKPGLSTHLLTLVGMFLPLLATIGHSH